MTEDATNAAEILGVAYFGATVWVRVEHNDEDDDWPRPPEGQYEATVIQRVDSPPSFRLSLKADNGWTFYVVGNTATGETDLRGWRGPA